MAAQVAHDLRDYLEIKTASPLGFSPDGDKLLVGSNLTGTQQLYRMPAGGGELEAVTSFKEPVDGGYLPASDRLLLAMSEGGNERLQIYLLDDDGKNLEKLLFDPEHIHRVGGATRNESMIAFASNRRDGKNFDIYTKSLLNGREDLVFDLESPGNSSVGFSPDGRYLLVSVSSHLSVDNDLHSVDLLDGTSVHLTPHREPASFGIPRWLPDSSGFFFGTDHSRDLTAIAFFDMATRKYEFVIESGWEMDCLIDWPGKNLLVATNEDGFSKLLLFDPQTSKEKWEIPVPGRAVLTGANFSRDGTRLTFGFTGATIPGDVWSYDLQTEAMTRMTTSPNRVSEDDLIEPELHRFDSFDGESIPFYLLRPPASSRNGAAIVVVHGGPEGQARPVFVPLHQYLANRGYAVVVPNVRGSTGYGKRYHHLDDKHKRLDSVEDLRHLHGWVARNGVADANRIALMGGSYGGYMTLAGLAFQPELWAAGVSIVGISSFVTFLENTSIWRREIREREYGSLAEDREFLEEVSPLNRVDQIRAPLFLVHGTNDPRVPLSEAQQIHQALSARGIEVEIAVYDDEGHGLSKLKNRLDAYPKVLSFLSRALPGV